jgi:hypothetical protein
MDTNGLTNLETIKQKISIGKGNSYSFRSFDVIMSLIDEKLIFIKTKTSKNWEQKNHSSLDEIDDRIDQLEKENKLSKSLLQLQV